MLPPEELPLSFFHHFECVEVDDAVVFLTSEADEVGNAGVWMDGIEFKVNGYFKLLGYGLLLLQLEESYVISLEQLDHVLAIDNFIDALGQLSLSDTRKDALDLDLLVDVIVMKEINFEVRNVAK
jgi:hypothetical protein